MKAIHESAQAQHEDDLIDSAKHGGEDAMQQLVMRYAALIRSLSQRICCRNIERDDLIQAGTLGLIQAVNHYEPHRGVKLITYAVPWILGEMKKVLRLEAKHSKDLSLEQEQAEKSANAIRQRDEYSGAGLYSIDLHIAFEKLPPEEQKLVILRYYRDRTQKETALMMDKSQAQISRMEQRTLDTLRAMLS